MTNNNVVNFNKIKRKTTISKRGYALYNEGLCFYRQGKDTIAIKKFKQAEDLGYESSDMFSSMARIYGAENNFEKVKEYAKKAINIDKEYGYPYFLMGGAFDELGDYSNALKYYLLAEKYQYDDNVVMFRVIAELYGKIEKKNFIKQLEYATKAIDIDPDNAFSWYWKGWIYFSNNNYSHALKYMLKAEKMGYYDYSLYYEVSYAYSMLGYLKKAIEYANKCIFMDKSDYLGYYRKGFAYFMEEDLQKAEDAFLLAEEKNCTESDMYSRLGYIYQIKEDAAKAIKYADRAIKLDKKDIDGYILKANVYAALYHDYRMALKYYKKAYKIGNNFNEDFYSNFAAIYNMLNRSKMALKIANEGLLYYPKSYNITTIKVACYQTKKQYDEAERNTQILIKLDPNNIWNNYYLALLYYNCKKYKRDYKKVVEYLLKSNYSEIEDFGGSDAVISFSYFELKEYDKSLDYFLKFFESKLCDEFIQKNKKEIRRYYRKLVKKFPDNIQLVAIAKKYPIISVP